MHFERSLRRAIYDPWRGQYIDYPKLKKLLRDNGSEFGDDGRLGGSANSEEDDNWTEEDEGAFVEELVNIQLEKVHGFQSSTVRDLRERTTRCEQRLEQFALSFKDDEAASSNPPAFESEDGPSREEAETKLDADSVQTLRDVSRELDKITKEMNELEKFSRINYSGFLKATKKHDRKRGHSYRVRPLMQVRLAALPFNKEDYSPLLFRISIMYTFIRQKLERKGKGKQTSFTESQIGTEDYTAHKFWVHPENLLELKTMILRRLPVLVYNPLSSKLAQGDMLDPTITSIYFDSPDFSLYNAKVGHESQATSLRLRWYDHLSSNPEIFCEKKTITDDETSHEQRFTITKQKYIESFIEGEYGMEKEIRRSKEKYGEESDQVHHLAHTVEDIQEFIRTNKLQPVLRANYTRTAFQIPGDSRVRITLDTDLALIREDSLDPERPIRRSHDWHRLDIDETEMEFPFSRIRDGEINRFPFALLEIRIKGGKQYEWASDLMESHLVKPAPRFSKFVHGVAQLFDDYVNTFPFWLSEVDTDIRRDPHQAFDEEQQRKVQAAEDQLIVGSLLKGGERFGSLRGFAQSPGGSPRSVRSGLQQKPPKATVDMTRNAPTKKISTINIHTEGGEESSDEENERIETRSPRGIKSLLSSMKKYTSRKSRRHLPPGIQEPTFWIKNEGPLKVEAKVWLANQRTFIKWQHIGVLMASLSLGLFNAAGAYNDVARFIAVIYTLIAVFAAGWGWTMYMRRSQLIRERSGKDFDNVIGPIIVCVGLIAALCLNFAFKFQSIQNERQANTTATFEGALLSQEL